MLCKNIVLERKAAEVELHLPATQIYILGANSYVGLLTHNFTTTKVYSES